MRPHDAIHRRCQRDPGLGRETQRRQQIRGKSVRIARNEIRRGRGDDDPIGPAGKFDMAHCGLGRLVPQIEPHRPPGHRLQTGLTDEFLRRPGHHDLDLGACLGQLADDLRRLVGSDAAGDAE
jgi:hypothetical protein